ncbi:MerR family transcriptional regulator [Nitratireductor rhodophyticola]|uniref:MerR family transcriptional regulator n=1 Tax=Nitratireductor rhodophyticola TaxID=2854036 RepID=UPI0008141685
MRIGELSQLTGASQRSLRLYEARGLIHAERSANGYRAFPPQAVERVRFIQDLLGCGFSTREIRAFLPCFEGGASDAPCAAGRKRFLRKLSQIETLLSELEQRRQALLSRVERMDTVGAGATLQDFAEQDRSESLAG